MHKIFLYSCLFFFSLYQETRAQEKPIIIPFEITSHNNLLVQALLNKQDTVHLMFHTASSSVTLIEESIKKLTSLHLAHIPASTSLISLMTPFINVC